MINRQRLSFASTTIPAGVAPQTSRAGIAVALLCLGGLCSADSTISRYTDLLRLAGHHQQPLEGPRLGVGVWHLDHHYRVALDQTPNSRSQLGPLQPGKSCRVHFGLAIDEDLWPATPEVTFRMSLRAGQDEETALFDERIGRAAGRERVWRERTVDLPQDLTTEFYLVLEGRLTSEETGEPAPTRLVVRRSEFCRRLRQMVLRDQIIHPVAC